MFEFGNLRKKFFILPLLVCSILFLVAVTNYSHNSMQALINDPNENMNGISYTPSSDKFRIFLVWKGDKYPDVYMKAFETLLYHHPKAEVLIFSNELNQTTFDYFKKAGFNIHVVRYNLTKMTEGKLGHDFARKADDLLNGKKINDLQVTSVHLSDFLRYFLVYYHGGLYLDTDMFVVRNLENLKNTIGVDGDNSYQCHDKSYSTPSVKNFSCLCNCMFSFDKGHPFLKEALENYESNWSKNQGYGPGGAVMLIKLIANHLNEINFIDNKQFLCNKYIDVRLDVVKETDSRIKDVLDNCYVYHLFGAGASTFKSDDFDSKMIGRVCKKFQFPK